MCKSSVLPFPSALAFVKQGTFQRSDLSSSRTLIWERLESVFASLSLHNTYTALFLSGGGRFDLPLTISTGGILKGCSFFAI